MGWTQQGYNAQGFNPALEFRSDYWYVENNGDNIKAVEKYYESKPDIDHWSNKIKIVYGCSGSEYFRGYLLTQDVKIAKRLLREFHGFLCYEHKYGGRKKFSSSNLIVFLFLELILFFEKNPSRFDKIIPIETVKRDLFEELEFGIKHKFINDFRKSLDEVEEELNEKIAMLF